MQARTALILTQNTLCGWMVSVCCVDIYSLVCWTESFVYYFCWFIPFGCVRCCLCVFSVQQLSVNCLIVREHFIRSGNCWVVICAFGRDENLIDFRGTFSWCVWLCKEANKLCFFSPVFYDCLNNFVYLDETQCSELSSSSNLYVERDVLAKPIN